MNIEQLKTLIHSKSTEATALLEADEPDMEKVEELTAAAEGYQKRLDAMIKAQTLAEGSKATKPAPSGIVVTKDATDNQAEDPKLPTYKHIGEQLYDVAQAARQGVKPSPRLLKAHKSAAKAISGASEAVPADGGFLIQEDFAGQLVKPDLMSAPILSRVRRIPMSTQANSTKLNGIDETSRATGSRWGGVRGYWLAEGDQFTSSKPKFREIRLEVHKVGAFVYATDEVIQDAAQLAAVVGTAAREELLFLTEDAILNGTGSGMPYGILAASNNALVAVDEETDQVADTIVAQNVIKMRNRRYKKGSYIWLIGEDVEPQLMQMYLAVGTGGQLVYMPPGGLSGNPYGNIFGSDVIESEYSAALGDQGDLLLVDLNQYLFCDKGSIQEAVSIHVRFDYDELCYRFIYRCDGQPAWHAPITPYKATSNTVSPYITLAERA